jgi:hypothetical protein
MFIYITKNNISRIISKSFCHPPFSFNCTAGADFFLLEIKKVPRLAGFGKPATVHELIAIFYAEILDSGACSSPCADFLLSSNIFSG